MLMHSMRRNAKSHRSEAGHRTLSRLVLMLLLFALVAASIVYVIQALRPALLGFNSLASNVLFGGYPARARRFTVLAGMNDVARQPIGHVAKRTA